MAALAIRLESPGPVIYRHRRVGRDGEPFELWKLRTMVQGAERMGAGLYIEDRDSRITRSGRRLRRFSLDELPNLVNVLRGELSIVGPRPTVQEQVDRYTTASAAGSRSSPGDHRLGAGQRPHRAARGPSGSSWTSGTWTTARSRLDLRILARTAKLLASGQGLYSEDLKQGWD